MLGARRRDPGFRGRAPDAKSQILDPKIDPLPEAATGCKRLAIWVDSQPIKGGIWNKQRLLFNP
jgi:hypothetical protein